MSSSSTPQTPKKRRSADDTDVKTPSPSKQRRTNDPKVFGNIPGVEVGAWWEKREGCSAAAVHAPWVAGIAGSKAEGAYSIALSGGYEDDEDSGNTFTYTGAGGRDLKGTPEKPKNLRTAPQSQDQSFSHSPNAALKTSAETKKPIRVVRGFKLNSVYAPPSGYRYDGLYVVESAWMERGKEGFQVCRFKFRRLDSQPPLPGTTLPVKDEGDAKPEVTVKSEIADVEMTVRDEATDGPKPEHLVGGSSRLEFKPNTDHSGHGASTYRASIKDEMDDVFALDVKLEVGSGHKVKVEAQTPSWSRLEVGLNAGPSSEVRGDDVRVGVGGVSTNDEPHGSPDNAVEPAFDVPKSQIKLEVDEDLNLEASVDARPTDASTTEAKLGPDTVDERKIEPS